MKQIPILFSTAMVQAILDGRKTMTRRIVKPRSKKAYGIQVGFDKEGVVNSVLWYDEHEKTWDEKGSENVIHCPYGKAGDILWVREMLEQQGELGLSYVADNEWIDEDIIPHDHQAYRNYACCNIPSIHMPKWASRIWLQVESIGVERLQNISESDAINEGIMLARAVPSDTGPLYVNYMIEGAIYGAASNSFMSLWQKINGAESWDANPYVWVVEFKILSTSGKPDNI